MANKNEPLLRIEDLKIEFPSKRGAVNAVNGICYEVGKGEIVGIVGESGSGKSVEAYSVMGLLKPPGRVVSGRILLDGDDLLQRSAREMERIRGREISMIFQDPLSCLDPVFTIGRQLTETILTHMNVTKAEARAKAIETLGVVGIADAQRIMRQYPYELSGGMRQRIMIAMAVLCQPRILIADEPTTALDVTIQAQIIQLLKQMREKNDMSIVFITHNFGVIADLCDRVYVMYGGLIMEEGSVNELFYHPAHPYTNGLLKAIPSLDGDKDERLIPVPGMPVDPTNLPIGCVFSERCTQCTERCRTQRPPQVDLGGGHKVSCWESIQ